MSIYQTYLFNLQDLFFVLCNIFSDPDLDDLIGSVSRKKYSDPAGSATLAFSTIESRLLGHGNQTSKNKQLLYQ